MPADPLARFRSTVTRIRGTATATGELSYYPAVGDLLTAVGDAVVCIQHPSADRGQSADLGLFARGQVLPGAIVGTDAWDRQVPEHGVVEAKAPDEPIEVTVASDQVKRYTRHYGKTIVTNLRDWRTVTLNPDGRTVSVDAGVTVAASEADLWAWASGDASRAAGAEQLLDYLSGAVAQGAPIAKPKTLARILATHARRALHHVETANADALEPLREQLEANLGVTFDDEQAAHFFRSGLVQTLFYGLFSTWVLTSRDADGPFDWRRVAHDLRMPPIINVLFEQYALPTRVRGLGIGEDLDRAADALNRVVADRFFDQFEHGRAIEYFYEPFLDAYDPSLRESLGVWYTPRPVVEYMVEEVDRRLREDFGLTLGLADESVVVLDPATGTGTFLSACLRLIARTLLGFDPENPPADHDPDTVDGLAAAQVREAALTRLFGFELLPAPFVIAHLRLGLMFSQMGVPLAEGQRAGVYLTNSLTGWDADAEPPVTLFDALREERDAAGAVKRDTRVLVVLGNPPYNAFAGVAATSEETEMIAPYKRGIVGRNSLDDLYVRFIRLAERRIAEITGSGIVALVTNRSYLRRPSFRSMREHLLGSFDSIDVTDLNGDRDETGKRTPSGRPDPSVFSAGGGEGIAEGVAVTVMARKPGRDPDAPPAAVTYRALWGNSKADDLGRVQRGEPPQDPDSDRDPKAVHPSPDNFHALQPVNVGEGYYAWTSLPDLAERPPEYGLHEARGHGLIDTDRGELSARMTAYLDASVPDPDLPPGCAPLLRSYSGFDPAKVRQRLTGTGQHGTAQTARPFDDGKVRRFQSRPFDRRWAYVERDHKLWVAHQERLVGAQSAGAWFLYALRTVESDRNGYPVYASDHVGDQHSLYYTAYLLSTRLPAEPPPPDDDGLPFDEDMPAGLPARPNLSAETREYLRGLGLDPDRQQDADLVFLHVLAFVNAPAYSEQHGDALRQQYPRVLLPATLDRLRASAALGARVRALLDDDAPPPSSPLLDRLGTVRREDGQSINPDAGDLAVTVAWGAVRRNGVMPGTGRTTSAAWSDQDRAAARRTAGATADAGAAGLTAEEVERLLGEDMITVHLNDRVRVERVPGNVWQAHIGGKHVMKKWLSYRPRAVSGRDLTPADARHLTRMTRALAALLLLNPDLDENYVQVIAEHAD